MSPTEEKSPSKKLVETVAEENLDDATVDDTYMNDRLGTLVRKFQKMLREAGSWEEFAKQVHGPSYLADSIDDIKHPAKEHLVFLQDQGTPVVVNTERW